VTEPGPETSSGPVKGYSREIGTLAKVYTDEQKYSGTNESLDYKLKMFYDICNRVDVPLVAYLKAFPTILKEMALDHFYSQELYNRPFEAVCVYLRNVFEGATFQHKHLDKWNTVILSTVIANNANKSTIECLQLLILELRKTQMCLYSDLRNTSFYYNKLVTICQGVSAYKYTISNPSHDIGDLVNKLQSAIVNYKKEKDIDNT